MTEIENVYCSVRTKYLNVIQVCIRVGRVNVVWWVGLLGSGKGMKTQLDSANWLFNWLHGAESFLGNEYTPFTSVILIPCIVEVQVPWLCSQQPTTGACPKSDDSIQCTSCSCHFRYNIIIHLHLSSKWTVSFSFPTTRLCSLIPYMPHARRLSSALICPP